MREQSLARSSETALRQDSPAWHRSPSPRADTTAIAWTAGQPPDQSGSLYVIAITRRRLDPETRAYLQRKEAEDETRMEAMRCLKRHLARRYYRLFSDRSRHRIEHQLYPGVP